MVTELACRVIVHNTGKRPDDIDKLQLRIDIIEHVITYYLFNDFNPDMVSRTLEILHMWLASEGLEDHTETTISMIKRYNTMKINDETTKRSMLNLLEEQGF